MSPTTHINEEHMLDAGDGHSVYTQDWGNKTAKHVYIFFHGGPGSNFQEKHKEIFDPETQRVIFFDQRGCGRSTPLGSLDHNTTPDLISDTVKILDYYKVEKAVVYGRSWGSAVGFAFAIAHPDRVSAMVMGSIFTGSQRELDWLDKGLFATHYPDVWEKFLERTPEEHQEDAMAWHSHNVLEGDAHQIFSSALAIEEMEHSLMSMDDRPHPIDPETFDPSAARLFTHYSRQACFLPERHILKEAHTLKMPVWIVHGRYDMDCPPVTAYELYKELPNAHLAWTISGHRADHEMDNVLRTIVQQF